ncbi:MAG: UDP-N-acetylmuramoyl-L-alanine--D-glutamate ligase [Gammaproteobacteria bacterium]
MKDGARNLSSGTRLIVGFGSTGASVARYLEREGLAYAVTDSRAHPPGADASMQAPHVFGRFESPLPADQIAEAVVSPGVSLGESLLEDLRALGVPVVGDIELFARALDRIPDSGSRVPSVIAITGTNGKSTVCSLVTAMARAAGRVAVAGANLGTPALDLIDPRVELYVLELSSFQLELTHSLAPLVATVLNVSDDHLDRHGSIEAYVNAKARIYARSRIAVFNREDARVMAMQFGDATCIGFGLDAPPSECDYGLREGMLCRGDQVLFAAADVPLAGRHNLANVLAAWAIAAAAGVDDASIARAVRAFRPLAHRLTAVGEHAGVRYFDDSKATNVSAATATLAGLAGPLVVIAGGQGKGQDFTAFAGMLAERARAVVLLGVDAPLIELAIAGRIPVVKAANMEGAVSAAARLAQSGDSVVLAPACASFDMFDNYGARGDAFARAVEALFDGC